MDDHIKVTLGADTAPAERALQSFAGNVSHIMQNAAGAMIAGFGLEKMAEKFGEVVGEIRNKARELTHLHEIIDLNVETIQQFGKQAVRLGLDADKANKPLTKLAEAIGEAAGNAGGEKAAVFEKMGIAVRDSLGFVRSMGEVLPEFAKGLADIQSPAERVALAMKIMGKTGADILPILKEMSEGGGAFKNKDGLITEHAVDDINSLNAFLLKFKLKTQAKAAVGVAMLGSFLNGGQTDRVNRQRAFDKGEMRHEQDTARDLNKEYAESGQTLLEFYNNIADEGKRRIFNLSHENEILTEQKALAEAQEQLHKASTEEEMKRANAFMKVNILEARRAQLLKEQGALRSGTAAYIAKEAELLKLNGELEEAYKARTGKIEEDRKKKQDEVNKAKEDELRITRKQNELDQEGLRVGKAEKELGKARGDFDTMSIADIAKLNPRGRSRNARQQIFDAQEVENEDQIIKNMRLNKASDEDLNKEIDYRNSVAGGITAASSSERNPFAELQNTLQETKDHMATLVDLAQQEGFVVRPEFSD